MNATIVFSELQQEPHSGLQFRIGRGAEAPLARVLLLHGVGGNEDNLASLARHLPASVEVLLLRAPLPLGAQGFAWFQVSFTANGPVIRAEQAEDSRLRLLRLLDALPPLPTVIAGFSQGGILSASVGLSAPEKVAGFGLLSGRILPELESHIAPVEALRSLSAFVGHGRRDDKLPAKWAELAEAWLQRLGVSHQTRFYEMGHEIIGEEVADFIQWLRPTLNLGLD